MSPIRLPALIYATPAGTKSLDDMRCGDLSEQQLKTIYHLTDVSTKVDPYQLEKIEQTHRSTMMKFGAFIQPPSLLIDTLPRGPSKLDYFHEEKKSKISKEECANILFDEFRSLSRPFALYGAYSGLIVKMINHMQNNTWLPFRDSLLNMALNDQIRHDFSGGSSLNNVKIALEKHMDWDSKMYPSSFGYELGKSIHSSVLPKFTRFKDKFNGLGITVHDTYATQITLKELKVSQKQYTACINYKIQDHFGLDKNDITKEFFKSLRFFRIWFILQRWNKLGYNPFITEMETNICIYGNNK